MKKNKPKVLGVTLARGGSKSVPNKNIQKINGYPLIAHTIIEAKKSKYLTRYIVSTDSKKIRNVAEKFNADVPFLRPKRLASDTATALEADQHALEFVEQEEGIKYDYFVELMATNPMKTSIDIDNAIEKLIITGADSVIGVTKLDDHHPVRIKKIEKDMIKDFCIKEIPETHRQQLKPDAYIRNGAIYAVKRNLLVSGKRYGTLNSRPYIMPSNKSVNIDNKLDFLFAEILIKKYHSNRFN